MFNEFLDDLSFHHIGYATKSIEQEIEIFKLLGYTPSSDIFIDETQKVRGCFIVPRTGIGSPTIELLENYPSAGGKLPLTSCLQSGIKMYHVAYNVEDIVSTVATARGFGSKLIVPPVPATAFGGNRISFVFLRNGLLVEFIEKSK